jgi:enoyl-CoA hydratase/carnithine racemase
VTGDRNETGDRADGEARGHAEHLDDCYDAVREAAADAETVAAECDDPVEPAVTVVLDRPDVRNAPNDTLREELADVLGAADDADGVRVMVLTGVVESGAFCAGADVNQLREPGLEQGTKLAVQLFATEDENEGIDAFLEDREPDFEGRCVPGSTA